MGGEGSHVYFSQYQGSFSESMGGEGSHVYFSQYQGSFSELRILRNMLFICFCLQIQIID